LVTVNNAAINIGAHISFQVFSFSLGKSVVVELPDPMVFLFLV